MYIAVYLFFLLQILSYWYFSWVFRIDLRNVSSKVDFCIWARDLCKDMEVASPSICIAKLLVKMTTLLPTWQRYGHSQRHHARVALFPHPSQLGMVRLLHVDNLMETKHTTSWLELPSFGHTQWGMLGLLFYRPHLCGTCNSSAMGSQVCIVTYDLTKLSWYL